MISKVVFFFFFFFWVLFLFSLEYIIGGRLIIGFVENDKREKRKRQKQGGESNICLLLLFQISSVAPTAWTDFTLKFFFFFFVFFFARDITKKGKIKPWKTNITKGIKAFKIIGKSMVACIMWGITYIMAFALLNGLIKFTCYVIISDPTNFIKRYRYWILPPINLRKKEKKKKNQFIFYRTHLVVRNRSFFLFFFF